MTNVCVPALHHLYGFLLVGNNRHLCQGLKQVVTLQNQVSLKKKEIQICSITCANISVDGCKTSLTKIMECVIEFNCQ